MQDQSHAMLQVSPVQIHHQYVHHTAALSSESPTAVLPQFALALTGAAALSAGNTVWRSAAGEPSCLPATVGDFAPVTTASLTLDNEDADVIPSTTAFQQLLDSFGSQSDGSDDIEDDRVVSVDECQSVLGRHADMHSATRLLKHHQQQQRLQQHHVVCSAARC